MEEIENPYQKYQQWSYPQEHYDDFRNSFQMFPSHRARLNFSQNYKAADDLREAGNRKFRFEKYPEAIDLYVKGSNILEDCVNAGNKREIKAGRKLQYKLFANIAISHLRMNDPGLAVLACKAALGPEMPEPENGKVYYRYAEASFLLGKWDDANKFIELALVFEPQDFTLIDFQKRILKAKNEEELELCDLYKKMGTAAV